MKTSSRPVDRPHLSRWRALLVPSLCLCLGAARALPAQPPQNESLPAGSAPQSSTPDRNAPPSPLPPEETLSITADGPQRYDPMTDTFEAQGNVTLKYRDITLTAGRVEGNLRRELIFSGSPRIQNRYGVTDADSIHFFPRDRTYHLENPRAVLSPDLFRGRVQDPVFLRGGALSGARSGYTLADHFTATTCIEPVPHYMLEIASGELFPYHRLVLRRIGVVLFGKKLLVIPYLVLPLDREARRFRTDYSPEFGQNIEEGYYARFPYAFAIGGTAAAFVRLDATQKRGIGYRVEQEYLAGRQTSAFNTTPFGPGGSTGFGGSAGAYLSASGYGTIGRGLPRLGLGLGPENGGLLAAQGYLAQGFNRNFNASFRHQQDIGGANRIGFRTELQRNSAYVGSNQSNQNTRFDFAHNDPAHGVNAVASLGTATNATSGFTNSQLSGNLRQTFDFGSLGANRNSITYSFDLTRSKGASSLPGGTETRSGRLESQFQFQHVSRDYSFQLQANKTTPIGSQTGGGVFGSLERFPELLFSSDTVNFREGWLKRLPLRFDFGVGRYSEPGSNAQTERTLLGLTLQDTTILRGRTEMTLGGGFEQRVYGDGAAQYILRNATRLRQHLGGRSGFDLNYQYEQPAGGTPFLFDVFGRTHYVTAEGGYLDDAHFQLTARVGYDLQGTSRDRPWQSLATRLMWRPTPSVRLDGLLTYDPNLGKLFGVSSALRLRGRRDFALDVLTRYDPDLKQFSQINSQFSVPVGRSWRVAGLLRYNGARRAFESRNLQIVREWDCLEASLTYSEVPYGFRSERQFYFLLRIKALPFFRSFARGPAGETVGAGLGDLF